MRTCLVLTAGVLRGAHAQLGEAVDVPGSGSG